MYAVCHRCWRFSWWLRCGSLVGLLLCRAIPATAADEPAELEAVQYAHELRTEPRPLQIHRVRIDLAAPGYELAVAVGRDPDGDGPVEATLTAPLMLAQQERLLIAVNTNPWAMLPQPEPGRSAGYVEGAPVDVSGWVRAAAVTRSPPQAGNWSFWVDEQGRGHVGNPAQPLPARCAVAGFAGLLQDGRMIARPGDVRHPRTAAGVDAEGRWLTLLVVDGRQPGLSEGVTEKELAELLLEAGCHAALNLDGGGSSLLLRQSATGAYQVLNRPSDARGPRPIPVMLGLRRSSPSEVSE